MDNVNQPPGQDPQEHPPTQPFRFTPGWPGGNAAYGQAPQEGPGQTPPGWHGQAPPPGYGQGPSAGYGQNPPAGYDQDPPGGYGQAPPGPAGFPGQPQPGNPYSQQPARPRRKTLGWAAGITAAVLLAAGGAVAGLKLTSSGSSPAPANAAQATALNSELSGTGATGACQAPAGSSSSSSSGSSSGSQSSPSAKTGKLRCHARHLHLLRLVKGMYGEVAFHTSGGTETLAFERGVIESASSSSVVVRARNGTTWTWSLVSNSIVRQGGKTATSSALAKGDLVFVGGQATGSAKDVRLIMVRPPASAKAPSSQSSSTSTSSAA